MFYYIKGTVALLDAGIAVLDCGGVGYELNVTVNTQTGLRVGEEAKLFVYTLIREDCFDLYGFLTMEEKRCFEMLIGVSGVGPKAAQSILSSNTPGALSLAILSGNEKALTVVPGIGKKIAQRVLLELKDKLSKSGNAFETGGFELPAVSDDGKNDKLSDATAALTVLGYSNGEIAAALKGLDLQNLAVEDIVRQALRNMMK